MWLCPTYQRPERLQDLAESWVKYESGRLMVRVYEHDPRKEDYFKIQWPEGWLLYESPEKGAGEALNGLYIKYPDEKTYGFIGDDVVLKTPLGLLEETAFPWYVAFPNDTIQGHRMPTHFCVGHKLAKVMGGIVPPMFKHNYMDIGLANIAAPFSLLRYCPEVVFQHNHFINNKAPLDDTYHEVYADGCIASGEMEDYGKRALRAFQNGYMQKTHATLESEFSKYE